MKFHFSFKKFTVFLLVSFLTVNFSLWAKIEKVHYLLSPEPIDVVIPSVPKDLDTLELCIEGIRKNGKNVRRIIVVSKERLTDSAEWFDEKQYPFSKRDLILEIFQGDEQKTDRFLTDPKARSGWIYQQFLKLYAPFVIPDISSNVLILDSDVIFLNPTAFMTEKGFPIFNTGSEYYKPYFNHMQRLLPDLTRVDRRYSGICNYMLFQRPILEDLFSCIETRHQTLAWKAICRCINHQMLYASCLSEYEIYFNFTLLRSNQARIQPLKWVRQRSWAPKEREHYRSLGFSYMSCDSWIRNDLPTFKEIYPKKQLEPMKDPEARNP
jgi:hypothetical protein